jgi:hypothetical protein
MRKLIFFLLVSWISIVHGFTQRTDAASGQLDSYPAPTPLANFKWKIYNPLSESSRYAIITHFISNNYSVVVPQKIQNIKVTKIDRNAFFRCGEMSQIVFPETLNDIGSSAFNRCYQLRRIVIPNGVSIIRESTFFKCSNLKEVILPDTINTIKEYAFSECKNLTHIIIPKEVREIESYAFSKCENLKTVKFLGDAPINVPNVFKGSQPILYRAKDSTGWEKLWSGRSVLLELEKIKN